MGSKRRKKTTPYFICADKWFWEVWELLDGAAGCSLQDFAVQSIESRAHRVLLLKGFYPSFFHFYFFLQRHDTIKCIECEIENELKCRVIFLHTHECVALFLLLMEILIQ